LLLKRRLDDGPSPTIAAFTWLLPWDTTEETQNAIEVLYRIHRNHPKHPVVHWLSSDGGLARREAYRTNDSSRWLAKR
jgi:hypothetical protein